MDAPSYLELCRVDPVSLQSCLSLIGFLFFCVSSLCNLWLLAKGLFFLFVLLVVLLLVDPVWHCDHLIGEEGIVITSLVKREL